MHIQVSGIITLGAFIAFCLFYMKVTFAFFSPIWYTAGVVLVGFEYGFYMSVIGRNYA
jgi:hypothetical protein